MGVTGGRGDCLQQPLVKARDPFIYLRNRKRFSRLHSLIQTREGLEEFVYSYSIARSMLLRWFGNKRG